MKDTYSCFYMFCSENRIACKHLVLFHPWNSHPHMKSRILFQILFAAIVDYVLLRWDVKRIHYDNSYISRDYHTCHRHGDNVCILRATSHQLLLIAFQRMSLRCWIKNRLKEDNDLSMNRYVVHVLVDKSHIPGFHLWNKFHKFYHIFLGWILGHILRADDYEIRNSLKGHRPISNLLHIVCISGETYS